MHNPVSEIIKDFHNQTKTTSKKNKQQIKQVKLDTLVKTHWILFPKSLLVDLEDREFKVSVL